MMLFISLGAVKAQPPAGSPGFPGGPGFPTPTNENLASLTTTISGGFRPTFSSGVTSYSADLAGSVNSITVTPTAASGGTVIISVRVNSGNYVQVQSGTSSQSLPLILGVNQIDIRVTQSPLSTGKVYTINVIKGSSNANLFALTLSNSTLSPIFVSETTNYTANVGNSTSSIRVTPTRSDANSTTEVRLNGGSYVSISSASAGPSGPPAPGTSGSGTSGSGTSGPPPSGTSGPGTSTPGTSGPGALALNAGSNTIDVKGTSENGITIRTYTITVTRAKADQTINFPPFAAKAITSPDFEPGASVDSGLPLTYTSSNQLVATVYQDNTDGGKSKIRIQGEGTTDIVAAQAGNSNYNSASVSRELIVANVLPVELINYQAKIQNNKEVLLSWITLSELNNAGFEIWKSTDGKSFEKLTFVKGAGNSNTLNGYSYIDLLPGNGANYYKLVQVDNNGTKSDNGIKSVSFSFDDSNEINIYPNPTADIVNVTFAAGIYQSLNIIDLSGKVLVKKNILPAENNANVSLSTLPNAVYVLQLTGKNGTISKQIVKK